MNIKLLNQLAPKVLFLLSFHFLLTSCTSKNTEQIVAEQWKEIELSFNSEVPYQNPYMDVDFWVEFYHSNGDTLIRPGFWDGGNTWKVRFASTEKTGAWSWKSFSSNTEDNGLNDKKGELICKPYSGNNQLIEHGFLRMSKGKRNVIHADGSPFLMIGDTPWAFPWRATVETAKIYAENRMERGFNTALLMSLQPDRGAEGPRSRTLEEGFDVAFEDLKEGHINHINNEYFQYFDSLRNILVEHGIVPVYMPVFHGFGWKDLDVLGWTIDPDEFARYTRYLIARYGAKPAMWLVGGDWSGLDDDGGYRGVLKGGKETEIWDCYQQPTGIHYSPMDSIHKNKMFQDEKWLDFQWCQTGHGEEHMLNKVIEMYNNLPVKAIADGEPTYEGIIDSLNGAGWWQGNEAWSQYLSGGTMGVVYGAGGLWNWKLTPNEKGWPQWPKEHVSWLEAIELPGAIYVGYLGKALKDVDIIDIEKHPELAEGNLCLAKPGKIYIVYLPNGGKVTLSQLSDSLKYRWFDPVKGEFISEGKVDLETQVFKSNLEAPAVLIVN